jgi:hypothetical protein
MSEQAKTIQALFLDWHDKKEKVVFMTPDNPSFILPSINEVSQLFFGKKMTTYQLVRFTESWLNIQSRISDSSLNNCSKGGVGKGVLSKLGAFFDQLAKVGSRKVDLLALFSTQKLFKYDKISKKSNYWGWLPVIHGIKQHDLMELEPMIVFLEARARQEEEIFAEAMSLSEGEKTPGKCLEFLRKSYGGMGHVDDKAMDVFFDLMEQDIKEELFTVDRKSMVALLKIKLDFYFCLLASYEVGLIAWIEKEDPDLRSRRPDIFERGLIGYWLPVVRDGAEHVLESPFESFLDYLRHVMKEEGEISWRELAKSIPVTMKEKFVDADTKHEAQISRLKEWRSGGYYPSREVFETFLVNLSSETNVFAMLDLATCSIALDKLVREDVKLVSKELSEEALAIVEEGYSCYPLYWTKYKAEYLD